MELVQQFSSSKSKSTVSIELDENDWSPQRRFCGSLVLSSSSEVYLAVLICFNMFLAVAEANNLDNPQIWMKVSHIVLLSIYTIEVAIRIYVLRCTFFRTALNVVDLITVLLDVIAEFLAIIDLDPFPSLSIIRILRILRIARTIKVMIRFPMLALMVKGVLHAMGAAMYGVGLLCVVLLFWSVCAVHLIHPVNQRVGLAGRYAGCERCERAFEGVFQSMLTLIQNTIAGDSWGMMTIPIIEESPWTAIFFALVFLTVSLTITNVILAVIVDMALEMRADDSKEVLRRKARGFTAAEKHFTMLLRQMDADRSGDLTVAEIREGFETNAEFRNLLLSMDIDEDDLNVVFCILDADGSGTIDYNEFIKQLFKMKQHDSHTLMVFMTHHMAEMRKDIQRLRSRESGIAFKPPGLPKDSFESKDGGASEASGEAVEAKHGGLCAPPVLAACAPAEEKKAPVSAPLVQEDSARQLWEELRDLRTAITEHVLRSMHEISRNSESHARLLATIERDTAALRGKDGPAACDVHRAPHEAGTGGLEAFSRQRPDFRPSISQEVLRFAERPDGAGPAPRSWASSPFQPAPSSAWGRCCGAHRTLPDEVILDAAPQKSNTTFRVNAV